MVSKSNKFNIFCVVIICLSFQITTKADEVINNELTGTNAQSLCTEKEAVVFSCSITDDIRTVSICALPNPLSNKEPTIQYRFGKKGETPELSYPKNPTASADAFTFLTRYNSSSIPLETVSFSRGDISYDVMTPEKAEDARLAPFTGVAVTLPYQNTQLLGCNQGSILVNLKPIKKLLHIKEDQDFSDALPKVNVDSSSFPVIHKVITTSSGIKISTSFSTVKDPVISKNILKFIRSCDSINYEEDKGSECSREVTADTVDDKYLVVQFKYYEYVAGTPHGLFSQKTEVYRKAKESWQIIKPIDLFISSDYCRESIASMVYRQLKPIEISDTVSNSDDLVQQADIYPTAQGIEFAYQPYQVASYADTPYPLLLSWKRIKSCLASF